MFLLEKENMLAYAYLPTYLPTPYTTIFQCGMLVATWTTYLFYTTSSYF